MVNEVMKFIENYDPEVGKAIQQEAARQRRNLELIEIGRASCRERV